MRLGYERIVKDKRISISVEESDDPWVTLKVQGNDEIRFKASDRPNVLSFFPKLHKELIEIAGAAHQAYLHTINSRF